METDSTGIHQKYTSSSSYSGWLTGSGFFLTVRGTDLGAASGSICINIGKARFACHHP
jgi:hypothetical protein